MGIKSPVSCFFLSMVLLISVGFQDSVQGRLLLIKKPDPDNAAATARWLVSQNSWGVLKYVLCELFCFRFIVCFVVYLLLFIYSIYQTVGLGWVEFYLFLIYSLELKGMI